MNDSAYLQALIDKTPNGGICHLPKQTYKLTERVVIRGRKNIVIEGNGAVLISRYRNDRSYEYSTDALLLEDCEGVALQNLIFDTDVPPNFAATVEKIDPRSCSTVIKADAPVRGDEVLMSFISYDERGVPDGRLSHYARHPDGKKLTLIQGEVVCYATYGGAKNEYLGENRFRVFFPKPRHLEKLFIGQRICVRHTMYGPCTVTLRGCTNTLLKDLTFHAVPGFAVLVLPRCRDLTVEGMRIERTRNMPMACNCDGIHVTGLTGSFTMKDCFFEGLGDDALNLHSTAGTVTAAEGNTLRCNYCKKRPDGLLPAAWCQAGDLLYFYHPETMQRVATAEVVTFCKDTLEIKPLCGTVTVGLIVQNAAFMPSCHVSDCTVQNSRAKGILLQTGNAEINHCTFSGLSHPAVRVAPAFTKWFEMGPCENLFLHHNAIVNCCNATPESAAVTVETSHGGNDPAVRGLHRNIRIENNTFDGMQKCIFVSSTDGVRIKNNSLPCPDGIETVSCTDLLIE